MADTTSASAEDPAAARAAELLRLRKERREAKMKANGASRLDKVMGLGGGPRRDPPATPAPAPAPPSTETPSTPPASTQPAARQAHADPAEVDISVSPHFHTPQTAQRIPRPSAPGPGPGPGTGPNNMTESQLRQLMLGLDQPPSQPAGGPDAEDDPMLNMLMQMLGGPNGSGPNLFANLATPPDAGTAPAAIPDRYASLWRLLHTAVALGLGLYIALWTSFSGTKTERELQRQAHSEAETAESARRFFYAFATAEAVLLTTRYFMDRGRSVSAAGGGVLGALVGFLPPPIKGYVEMGMRYAQIFGTVRADVLVCIFVLGACSWARS